MRHAMLLVGAFCLVMNGCGTGTISFDPASMEGAASENSRRGANPGGGGSDLFEPTVAPVWTQLFYFACDNATEPSADLALAELEALTQGIEEHGSILVLLDRATEPGVEVFEIAGGERVPVASYAELDTSDAAVLEEFVAFGLAEYPNERTLLAIKSEGFGWRGLGRDNTHDEEVADGLMSFDAMAGALAAAQQASGGHIDLLVLEGNNSAMMEIAYELRDAASILIGTQTKIQEDGIPYWLVLRALLTDAALSDPAALAGAVADSHLAYYDDQGNNGVPSDDTSQNFATISAFDLQAVPAVIEAHAAFADVLVSHFDTLYNLLPHARDRSMVGTWGSTTDFDYTSDIGAYMDATQELVAERGEVYEDIDAAIAAYWAALANCLIAEVHAEKYRWVPHGVSVWFPPTWNKFETWEQGDVTFASTMDYDDPALALDFVTDSTWLSYLYAYFDASGS